MPLWGTILTVCFSGVIALVAVGSFFVTRSDINHLRSEIQSLRVEMREGFKSINDRIDRHLEGHP